MKKNIPPLQPGAYYHIYNRGVNRENLFKEERNYPYFLRKYEQYVSPVAETYAYCLLKNHFHILIRTKPESDLRVLRKASLEATPSLTAVEEVDCSKILSNAFASLFKSYAQSINKAHGRTGALFEEPFRRIEVKSNAYFSKLVHYIHMNPQTHGFVDDFKVYPHSSFAALLSEKDTRLFRNEVLEWFGGRLNFKAFHENLPSEKLSPELGLDE
jgi:putative transposase